MRTHYKGSPEEVKALNAYVKLMRAAETVTSRVHKHLVDHRLTVSQFGVLEALYHLGPMSQATIAQKILKSTGNITMIIDNLEKRNLVKREKDDKDRRFFKVSLTEEGHDLIQKIFPGHAEIITREMAVLSAGEQEELGRICRKLGLREK